MTSVEAAVKKRLAELPEAVWTSVDALVALNLAHQMDTQTASASAGKLLIEIMTRLAGDVKPTETSASDQLRAKRQARLANAAGQ